MGEIRSRSRNGNCGGGRGSKEMNDAFSRDCQDLFQRLFSLSILGGILRAMTKMHFLSQMHSCFGYSFQKINIFLFFWHVWPSRDEERHRKRDEKRISRRLPVWKKRKSRWPRKPSSLFHPTVHIGLPIGASWGEEGLGKGHRVCLLQQWRRWPRCQRTRAELDEKRETRRERTGLANKM